MVYTLREVIVYMDLIVQKFGGSSLKDINCLNKVADIIINEYENNKNVVVVVSAQGNMTNKLIEEEKEITKKADLREHDFLLSVGEQISAAKLSMFLQELGYEAIAYTAWQLPIITNKKFGDADIIEINVKKIEKSLEENKIVIVTGFQGVDREFEITTLGRGGSDTTAVYLAHALNAKECYIYTDVDGVYTEDPNKIGNNAKKLKHISYDNMLEMANNGAKVMHNKSIEIAKKYNVKIIVKSTFENTKEGTIISFNK